MAKEPKPSEEKVGDAGPGTVPPPPNAPTTPATPPAPGPRKGRKGGGGQGPQGPWRPGGLIGRLVRYILAQGPNAGQVRPATPVAENEDGTVSMHVHLHPHDDFPGDENPGHFMFKSKVPYDPEGKAQGSFHLPDEGEE